MSLEWAFGNEELSDVLVVMTTESPEQCRARLAGDACGNPTAADEPLLQNASTAQAPSAGSAPAEPQPVYEELYAHKLVLFSHSQYFKAASRWQAWTGMQQQLAKRHKRNTQNQAAGSNQQDSDREVIIISLDDAQRLTTAKAMLRFMYTRILPVGVDHSEVMHLYELADQYDLDALREACLLHLVHACPDAWPASEQEQLLLLLPRISNDTQLQGLQRGPATNLVDSVHSWLLRLEDFWQVRGRQKSFQQLSHSLVLRVLQSEELGVLSEDTVLVAALSWLRGAVGRSASLEERRQVLAAVRLLQLQSWFLSWLLCCAPEAHELLQPDSLTRLVRYGFTHSQPSRERIAACDAALALWNTPRPGRLPARVQASVRARLADVVEAIKGVHAGTSRGMELHSEPMFCRGFEHQASLTVQPIQQDGVACAQVTAGITTDMTVGGEVVESGAGVLKCNQPSLVFSCGSSQAWFWNPFVREDEVTELGQPMASQVTVIRPDDDPLRLLAKYVDGSSVSFHISCTPPELPQWR